MNPVNRRSFLRTSAFAAAALSARSWAGAAGANGDIRVAIVGLNGRGRNHLQSLQRVKGVRIVALCDVDSNVLARAKKSLSEEGSEVRTYVDLREQIGRAHV